MEERKRRAVIFLVTPVKENNAMQRLFLFALMFTANAFAGVEGKWAGDGTLSSAEGARSQCSQMSVQIQVTAKKLSFAQGSFVCEGSTLHWQPMSFEVRGSTLWRDGLQVGTHSGDALTLSFPMGSETWIEVNATREGNRLQWTLRNRDTDSQTVFQAQLQKR
jgi:hypothetical protein